MSFVQFRDVTKVYQVGDTKVEALKGLSFEIGEGEFVVIVGPSGSGKTTLLNILGGMDGCSGGEIFVGDTAVHLMKERQLTKYRRDDVGFVFQFYNLMPNLTALENIELAVEICKNPHNPKEVLDSVGLAARAKNFPSQLSGGEQQRVSIARSIAKNSRILLCDEPTGALDYETGKMVLRLLQTISRERGKTVILVTHNGALRDMADKVISIKNGLVEDVIINSEPKSINEIEW